MACQGASQLSTMLGVRTINALPREAWRLKLPNGNLAKVDEEKLVGYLLSDSHPVGRFKAAFFRGLGYSPDHWEVLVGHILAAVETHEATLLATSSYGTKYAVRCTLSGRSGHSGEVETIWIIGSDELPRFVTAYPAG